MSELAAQQLLLVGAASCLNGRLFSQLPRLVQAASRRHLRHYVLCYHFIVRSTQATHHHLVNRAHDGLRRSPKPADYRSIVYLSIVLRVSQPVWDAHQKLRGAR